MKLYRDKAKIISRGIAGLCLFISGVLTGAWWPGSVAPLPPSTALAFSPAKMPVEKIHEVQPPAHGDNLPHGTDGVIRGIPVATLVRAYGSPLGSDLVPKENLLSLGFNEEQFRTIQTAFREFKTALEVYEKNHSTLKAGPDGEYYEIKPFELAGNEIGILREKLTAVTGKGDWRAEFLIESLKASSDAAGLGKYRQEVAMEQHNLGGEEIHTVMSRVYDEKGIIIDGSGYQVRAMKDVTRYRSLFDNR